MTKDRIRYLYKKYLDNNCSEEEFQELKDALTDQDHETIFHDLLDESWTEIQPGELVDMKSDRSDRIFGQIVSAPRKKGLPLKLRIPLIAAATVLLALSISFLIRNREGGNTEKKVHAKITKDILPGVNKAVLTLAGGRTITLKSEKNGIVVTGNKFVYNDGTTAGASDQAAASQTATLSTPAGGQYQITLSDGTKVWLNAESRLRYPVEFNRDSRTVELEGEGYFEVAGDSRHPFIVESAGQKIEVLGTHFNVNAYRDENSVKTTLLEGKVRVSNNTDPGAGKPVILSPGQQARSISGESRIYVNQVSIEETMDWKDGLFLFNNESLKSIMNRLSHWYNIDVVYEGNVDDIRFTGTHHRSKGLNNLLKNIEQIGKARFRTEEGTNGKERRIIVTANY